MGVYIVIGPNPHNPGDADVSMRNGRVHDKSAVRPSYVAISGAVLSILSLFISIVSLYFSALRASDITISVSESLFISYGFEGNLGIAMSLAFSNAGARPGIVSNVMLRCERIGSNESTDLFEVYYASFEENGGLKMEAFPVPEVVKAGDKFNRLILFWSSAGQHEYSVGDYSCSVLARLDGMQDPKDVAHMSFSVIQQDIDSIKAKPGTNPTNRWLPTHESGVTGRIILKSSQELQLDRQ
jgi:hypothetical protein